MKQQTSPKTLLAIDIGAGSGRLMGAAISDSGIELKEYYRFPNAPVEADGMLRWDIDALDNHIRQSLASVPASDNPVSVGVDTWGVDFVLLDDKDQVIEQSRAYRNEHTRQVVDDVFARVGQAGLYGRTGIQVQHFNTIFQLFAMTREKPCLLDRARRFLMMPDYLHWRLSGVMANEYSDASTTALLNARNRDWDGEILAKLNIPAGLFSKPVMPGAVLAERVEIAGHQLAVVAPATHDTGSGVAAVPASGDDHAYIATGTWCLIGVENQEPDCSEAARLLNFTNEGGVGGKIRFLKNCMGLWLIRRLQESLPGNPGFERMVSDARQAAPFRSLVNCDDASFFNPDSMTVAIDAFCQRTGQPIPDSVGAYTRCCVESLALTFNRVIAEIRSLRQTPINRIHLVGGGVQNELLCQMTADASGLPVQAGPVEATALGNVLVQAQSLGIIASLQEGRDLVRKSFGIKEYLPRSAEASAWREAGQRYAKLI